MVILPNHLESTLPPLIFSNSWLTLSSFYSSYDVKAKLSFMSTHNIDISVISLANPWLDWLSPSTAAATARTINDDLEAMCGEHEGKLYGFATLPLSAEVGEVVSEVGRVKGELGHMRGVVMGSGGLGEGLDDLRLDGIWGALEQGEMMVVGSPLMCKIGLARLMVLLVFAPALRSSRLRLWAPRHRLRPCAPPGSRVPS